MLLNYLKIAWRNLKRNKSYAFINIGGLAVGIACCLLIGLYVYAQLRYDRFHKNSKHIYRVINTLTHGNQTESYAMTPKPLASFLETQFPEVKKAVPLHKQNGVVRIDKKLFNEPFLVAGKEFLQIFSFPLAQGDSATIFEQRDQILLTESAAQKFFGSKNVVGKRLSLRIEGQYYPATVGGILKDPPAYSSIKFKVVIPLQFWKKVDPEGFARGNNWGTLLPATYTLLAAGSNPSRLEQKVENAMKEQLPPSLTKGRGIIFQPITAVHFDPSVKGGLEPTANVSFIYIAVVIAILILIIACINFMSISIGQSARRAREVGMRKTVGAYRRQVMAQFWSETFLVILFALALGLMLTELFLPYFNALIGKSLVFSAFENPVLIAIIAGIALLSGLLAGSYPAAYLSKFDPSQVFRNKANVEGHHLLIRSLTAIQFALATTLIIGTLFMNQQMELLRQKNLGFDKDLVVKVKTPFREGKHIIQKLRTNLGSQSNIKNISASMDDFNKRGKSFQSRRIKSGGEEVKGVDFRADSHFLQTMKIGLIQGRNLRKDASARPVTEVLVNKKLVKSFGWKNPIGKKVSMLFSFKDAKVVGVVQNFNIQSLHQSVQPVVIRPASFYTAAFIRIGQSVPRSLKELKAAWGKTAPGLPFNYTFLDQAIAQQYRADSRWVNIIRFASAIAIFIACMGLFGLAMLASLKRSKEISIRKILGATVWGVTAMLSKDFLKPVGIALLISIPVSYWLMQSWLQNFAYKIALGLGTYVVAVFITLIIALATVSWQSIKAALANPVDSLRSE